MEEVIFKSTHSLLIGNRSQAPRGASRKALESSTDLLGLLFISNFQGDLQKRSLLLAYLADGEREEQSKEGIQPNRFKCLN